MSSSSERPLAGKTCLVTGATSGIGEVTAHALARQGAAVIVVGRDPARCWATVETIRRDTGNPDVVPVVADLSSEREVRRLADEFRSRHDRLEVLVNNAGAMFAPRAESVDGIEMTWALNHLAYFLLTHLLLDPLRAAAPSRIVNVASDAHRAARRGIDFDDVEGRRRYRPFRAYAQSKLANVMFTFELARRLEGSGVSANALHPGFVMTRFFLKEGRLFWLFKQFARLLAITPEEGARTSIHVASSPEVSGVTGRYFEKCRPATPSAVSRDPDAGRRLWSLSEEMTGLGGSGHP
jgi:NAD(P)-dependent dehydrogenase (short-subunit alcohol dehydrogenase family)